ncbi:MAG TPA: hypothetical protein DEH78_10885 [Solibacterales bacterium]|nr:hypothetical protein [Bryobacterales bacterium]
MPEEIITHKGLLRRGVAAEEIRMQRAEKATTITFPASSEEPVERCWGVEVLSYENGAVRLDRATRGAMPLLFNHNVDDPIGMITAARIEKNRLMVDAQLFGTARAEEVRSMIEGGLRNVSLAYRINKIEEDTKTERFTVTDWEPYEVSIVTVPADPTVGIGRGAELEYEVRMVRASHQAEESAATRRASMPEEKKETATVAVVDETKEKLDEIKAKRGLEVEAERKRAIENLSKANRIADSVRDAWIEQGYSLEAVSRDLLTILEERGKTNPQPASKIGMSRSDADKFSLARAIRACAAKSWQRDAPYELEVTRTVAQKLGEALGQQVIVENRAGAGTQIGVDAVAKAAPDGYTLLVTNNSLAVNHTLYPKLPYDTHKDIAAIIKVASTPNILVVHPSVPAKDLKEFIAYVKANPGKLNFGSAGNGTSHHLTVELFKQLTKTFMTHIPYRGAGPMMQDLLGGQIPLMFINQDVALPHIKSGKLRAIAVTTAKRMPALPNVPTIAESGVPGYEATIWYGVVAPAGTPAAVIGRLGQAFTKAVTLPEMKERLTAIGADPAGGGPDELAAFIRNELATWARVIKASGIRIE